MCNSSGSFLSKFCDALAAICFPNLIHDHFVINEISSLHRRAGLWFLPRILYCYGRRMHWKVKPVSCSFEMPFHLVFQGGEPTLVENNGCIGFLCSKISNCSCYSGRAHWKYIKWNWMSTMSSISKMKMIIEAIGVSENEERRKMFEINSFTMLHRVSILMFVQFQVWRACAVSRKLAGFIVWQWTIKIRKIKIFLEKYWKLFARFASD